MTSRNEKYQCMIRAAVAIALLVPFSATAEPIQLKLSYFESEQTNTYLYGIKPFVDAINAEGKGLLAITLYPNGALEKGQAKQPQLVLDGVADIAFVVPGVTPYRFPDNVLLEQPGLFRDAREGTLAYTRLIAAGALRGYQDFFVIGAYTPGSSIINSRIPIESLIDIKGQKISANNTVGAEALRQLGATPTVLESSKLAQAIEKGAIDGSALSPTALFDFGIPQVTKNHYLLRGGAAPLALVMNRKRFDSLPEAAKALIRKYSGERAAATWIDAFEVIETQLLDKLKSDTERKVVEPSPSDREAAQRIYQSMIHIWAEKSARNRELLLMVEAEFATVRSAK